MRADWTPLPSWPYPPQQRLASRFQTSWSDSLEKLDVEIQRLGGKDVLIGVVATHDQFRMDGQLRAGAHVLHPGVEVSFTDKHGVRRAFHTDRYPDLHSNIHAVASGLEALRAVERHGIADAGQQYAGFAMLGAGGVDRGRVLVQEAGGITAALKRHHPDHGGNAADFAAVDAYRKAQKV